MKQVSGKDLARTVKQHGWRLLRVNGSHHIFGRPGNVAHLPIPIHGSRPLKLGLLKHLLKQAGLNEQDL